MTEGLSCYGNDNPSIILDKKGPYKRLRADYLSPIIYKGLIYPSIYHCYTCQKLRPDLRILYKDLTIEEINNQVHPSQLSTWDKKKLNIMYSIVKSKYEKEPSWRRLLKSTKGYNLIYPSTETSLTFWSVNSHNFGKNKYGEILIRVRNG